MRIETCNILCNAFIRNCTDEKHHLPYPELNRSLLLVAGFLIGLLATAQVTFNEITGHGFPEVYNAASDYADIDGDGDTDFLITGSNLSNTYFSSLYFNDGDGNFSLVSGTPFDPVSVGAVKFADLDGDTDKDLVLTGQTLVNGSTTLLTKIYENDGVGNFSLVSNSSVNALVAVRFSSLAVADIDGDNDLDIYLSGNSSSGTSRHYYQNNGSFTFSDVTANNDTDLNVRRGSADFIDVDNDGDIDLLTTGWDGSSNRGARIYINGSNVTSGSFDGSPAFELSLGVNNSEVAFSDIDGDNDVDWVISGSINNSNNRTTLYINNGTGLSTSVANTTTSLPNVALGSVDFSDFDLDGDDDLFITGSTETGTLVSRVYTNDGSGSFTWLTSQTFTPVSGRSESLVFDTDGDGDEDIIYFGRLDVSSGDGVAKYYKNESASANNNAPTDITLSNTSIDENLPTSTILGTLQTEDLDTDDTHTYTLSGTDASNFFISVVSKGSITSTNIRTNESFDFETKSSYAITITTDDSNGGTFSKDFTITVNDVDDSNNAPTNITLNNTSVDENLPTSTIVGTLQTEDSDSGDTHTYSLSGTDASNFFISVVSKGGITSTNLRTNESFDFETKSSHVISITTDDDQGGTFSKDFTITVNDVNDVPIASGIANITVNEDATELSSINLDDVFSDQDDANLTYSVEVQTGADIVSVALNNSILIYTLAANASGTATVNTTAMDDDGASASTAFDIVITPVNDAPTDIMLSNSTVDENEDNGTLVGLLSTADLDINDTHSYSLSGTDASTFMIQNGNQLEISESVDFETQNPLTITITTDDGNGGTFTKDFTIAINDVNESPVIVSSLGNVTVSEDANDPYSTDLTSIFSDPDGDVLTFSSTDTFEGAVNVAIDDSNILSVALSADYNGSGTITVMASDAAASVSSSFMLTVSSVNDEPVFTLDASETTQQENFTGVISVSIVASEVPDDEVAQTITYSISSDDTDIVNANIVGTSVEFSSIPDISGRQTFTISANDGQTENNLHSETFLVIVEETVLSISPLEDQVSIYPNPASNILNIKNDSILKINILSIDGKMIRSNISKRTVNISELKAGQYILQLFDKDAAVKTEIMIKK